MRGYEVLFGGRVPLRKEVAARRLTEKLKTKLKKASSKKSVLVEYLGT